MPMRFIPLIERNGLIVPIGAWVLHEACRQFVSWDHGQLTLAVNVAVQQLVSEGFVAMVHAVLEESGIAPERLCLEITETSMTEDLDFLVQTLEELKALGVSIAIDDFGVGYASLRQLRTRIPVELSIRSGLSVRQADRPRRDRDADARRPGRVRPPF